MTSSALDFGPRLEVAVRSLSSPKGGGLKENQDNYVLIDTLGRVETLVDQSPQRSMHANWPDGHVRLAVLDGVGGHAGGREIAERIASKIAELPAFTALEQVEDALDALHRNIQAEFARAHRPPGATLVFLEIPATGEALLYHVGDSRLYAITPSGALCLTLDHCPATAQHLQGEIDAEEWKRQIHEEHRKAIGQAFGMGSSLFSSLYLRPELTPLRADMLPDHMAIFEDRRRLSLTDGTLYLLATDGWWSYPEPQTFIDQWPALLCPPGPIASRLDDLATAHILASIALDDVDNTTGILLRTKGWGGVAGP